MKPTHVYRIPLCFQRPNEVHSQIYYMLQKEERCSLNRESMLKHTAKQMYNFAYFTFFILSMKYTHEPFYAG